MGVYLVWFQQFLGSDDEPALAIIRLYGSEAACLDALRKQARLVNETAAASILLHPIGRDFHSGRKAKLREGEARAR